MKKYIVLFVVMQFAFQVSAQQHEFGWLIGVWKLKDKNVYETWKLANDRQSLEGFSFKVTGNDTLTLEKVHLTRDANGFHYIPDVAENAAPVDFKISSYDRDRFVAENQQHDFPKVIRYTWIRKQDKDLIEAAIEGNGKVIPYHFERVR
jgi:hypothetical protein